MIPLQITVRSIPVSPVINYHINKHFRKVYHVYDKITRCRVVIDAQQRHKHGGKIFTVCVDMNIPGKELVCRKEHQNLYVAIRDAFDATDRLLKKSMKRKLFYANRLSAYHIDDERQLSTTSAA